MTTVPRTQFIAQLSRLELPNMQAFLRFAREPDARGAIPCWGAIGERFEAQFPTSAARLQVWRELVELGDRRPQLLFIDLNRARPDVLEQVVADASRLAEPVQRVLVTSHEARPFVLRSLTQFKPAARQLLDHPPQAIERERLLQQRALQKLREIRFFAADDSAPAVEPSRPVARSTPEPGAALAGAPRASERKAARSEKAKPTRATRPGK
jgi:hypothetical protein